MIYSSVTTYLGNRATREIGRGEVSEDVIDFFVGVDAMLKLDDELEGRDHPRDETENGQCQTSCLSESRKKICNSTIQIRIHVYSHICLGRIDKHSKDRSTHGFEVPLHRLTKVKPRT
jgi:hypothetical protein